ncbi:uncharacterized protein LOC110830280 isoform X2 [Zootermopsis nevadensis]|uniref:uncharacterized protein LOC110830280 isoform X2 n=1 Tax=Zootermopsis nevadensis TaxID=136037 RepID=UPI000B8EE0B8|nr:uncharacterized protein LOC110830280 isoform X2 [Zootermopsis nevadensis]
MRYQVHEKDPWSKLICHHCACNLQEFYDFRELCVSTDTYVKTRVSWEPQRQSTPVTSQHASIEPRDVHIKEEVSSGQPSNSSPLLPEIKFSQNTLVSNNLYTEECAGNLPHTSVLTQAPLPASAPPTNVAFFNSEQGECFLPEELEAAHSDSSVVDQDAGSPNLGVNKKITFNTNTTASGTETRKRNNTSDDVQVSKKKKNTSESHSRSDHEIEVNTAKSDPSNTESQDSNKQRQKVNHEPGIKSHATIHKVSVNDNISVNVRSNAKGAEQKNKNCKSGPKSEVGGKDHNLENNYSDAKIANSLDAIDMTDNIDSSVEKVDEGDRAEGLMPHVLLTRIPGICNIYTCSVCERIFTSKGCANNHVCV